MAELVDRVAGVVQGVLRLGAAGLVALIVVPPAMAAAAAATLLYAPLPTGELPEQRPQISAVPSIVLDADGRQIATFRGFDRTVEVRPSEIPAVVRDAVVAIEDQRFWEHAGVDLEGIGRAARTNVELGEVAQGGSTITQQYVKNVYLSRERTLERKVEEALLAIELEKRLTKDEILFGYLTSSYFGDGAYGIGAAAQVYFGKQVSDLDISEAATLAGMVQAPTRLSPRNDLEAAERRRRLVLQAMADQGYLTRADLERELVRTLWFAESGNRPDGSVTVLVPRPPNGATDHPFFVDWVEQDLLARFGPDLLYHGGLTIETSIDPERQAEAESAVAARLENTEYPIEMSLVSLEPATGHVVAMVGGRDYAFSQVNLATGGSTGFQPGSSFKPIVLAAAFNMGTGPETTYPAPAQWSAPNCHGDQCTISNYDFSSRGDITLRQAMTASVNTVFAQLVLDVTIPDTVELARDLGLERLDPNGQYGASLSLGAAETSPLEMASAYGTFANSGTRQEPTGIVRVIDGDGNVLVDNRARTGTPVLDPIVADNVTDVLVNVVAAGTGKRAQLDRPVAGKTGTAQNYRAAWFVGYTPELATAVWMGHADRLASLRGVNGVRAVTGGSHPAIAWREYMAAALEGTEPTAFPVPSEIVPLAETAEEVVYIRPQEETTARSQRPVAELAPNCGGVDCEHYGVPSVPHVPPPEQPTTTTTPEPVEAPTGAEAPPATATPATPTPSSPSE
ncbi:MAG: PBP1A family penicillin-binding protein [Acidimicrobiia bacterium]|nr:PBP1A family penicillin-binding protein [Acidimicrobiia bacterium]